MTAIAITIGWICVSACVLIIGNDIRSAIRDLAHSVDSLCREVRIK